jgi:uncharacterized membrane protein YphA (DoxX/SURF4 family)
VAGKGILAASLPIVATTQTLNQVGLFAVCGHIALVTCRCIAAVIYMVSNWTKFTLQKVAQFVVSENEMHCNTADRGDN